MVLAQAGLHSNRIVRSNVAMTGETTLRGWVLAVGGINQCRDADNLGQHSRETKDHRSG